MVWAGEVSWEVWSDWTRLGCRNRCSRPILSVLMATFAWRVGAHSNRQLLLNIISIIS